MRNTVFLKQTGPSLRGQRSKPSRTVFRSGCADPLKKGQRPRNSRRAGVMNNLLTVFYVDTSDEKRFLQILTGQFLCFALIFSRSPRNSCRFDPIYYHGEYNVGTDRLD